MNCPGSLHVFALSDDLKNSDVHHEIPLSNAYRMCDLPERRNYFQEFFVKCYAAQLRLFLRFFVTSCTCPNLIPRDRHEHLASACYTRRSKRVATHSRECRIPCRSEERRVG